MISICDGSCFIIIIFPFNYQEPKEFLQLMLDASGDNMETAENENASVEDSQKFTSSSSSFTKRTLSDDEVVSLATMFLLAGFEATSNALAFTSYLLAINPDKQEKLCADIDAYSEENEVIHLQSPIVKIICVHNNLLSFTSQEGSMFTASQSLQYLDWAIQESLRLYPPGPT